jgi:hypothetical protein
MTLFLCILTPDGITNGCPRDTRATTRAAKYVTKKSMCRRQGARRYTTRDSTRSR